MKIKFADVAHFGIGHKQTQLNRNCYFHFLVFSLIQTDLPVQYLFSPIIAIKGKLIDIDQHIQVVNSLLLSTCNSKLFCNMTLTEPLDLLTGHNILV